MEPPSNQLNYKTPQKHKTIELTESLDLESLKKIENENSGQNNNRSTNQKKKHKVIYLRR